MELSEELFGSLTQGDREAKDPLEGDLFEARNGGRNERRKVRPLSSVPFIETNESVKRKKKREEERRRRRRRKGQRNSKL